MNPVWLLLLLVPVAAAPPVLHLESSPGMGRFEQRIAAYDPAVFQPLYQLTGLSEPGPPIHVILAGEDTPLARRTPPSLEGWALGEMGIIVLFPARAPSYPFDGFEELLLHEVAHVFIDRAARGNDVPRWFHEGLAMLASGQWSLQDRGRLALEMMGTGESTLAAIGASFGDGEAGAARAYAFSGAFLRDLVTRHGPGMPAAILAEVGRGTPFEAAFFRVTGETLRGAERQFWRQQTIWNRWVPFLTSSTAVGLLMFTLALAAIRSRARKTARVRARWEEEERRFESMRFRDAAAPADEDDDEPVN